MRRPPFTTLLPGLLLGVTVLAEIVAVALSWGLEPPSDTGIYAVTWIGHAAAGALIARRLPRNPIGWLFIVQGLLGALMSDLVQGWALRGAERGWPGVLPAEWLTALSFVPGSFLLLVLLLLFPDGRPAGPRWRPLMPLSLLAFLLVLPGWAFGPELGSDFSAGVNPYATGRIPTTLLSVAGITLLTAAYLGAVASLVARWWRADGDERRQLKLMAAVAGAITVFLPVSAAFWRETDAFLLIAPVFLLAIPIAAAVAILRYRLYDIDVIVDRAVVYAGVTAVLAAAYGLTAVTLGTAVGRGSGWATAGATLVVAIAFRPVRDRVQDVVDRRFHRARYRAVRRMADFLEEVRAGRVAPDEIQGLLRELTSDPGLDLLLLLPESQVHVDARGHAATGLAADPRARLEVERGGRPVGLVLHTPSGASAQDPALLRTLVEAGGLAVEITRLQAEIRRQLAEVEASRARIVQAGTEERRRLERDLHDGAQQRLISIGLALRHAQHALAGSPAEVGVTLEEAVKEVTATITELRELSRGLPPGQLDSGLAPAFRDLARRSPVPVTVDAPRERFDRGLEGAAWFIGCEGVTNAVKHAQASAISITAGRCEDRLVVTVVDDGVGGAAPSDGSGLTGLADRVAALGGVLHIESPPGAGTTLTAELPCGS